MKIQRRRERKGLVEVYTASLNDIMFFLLLFFLIISTMVTPAAIKVLLPNASASEQIATKKNISLVVTADKKYFLNDMPVERQNLPEVLGHMVESSKASNEDLNILLQADKSLNLQDVVDMIDLGNQLGVKMVLFTQKPK